MHVRMYMGTYNSGKAYCWKYIIANFMQSFMYLAYNYLFLYLYMYMYAYMYVYAHACMYLFMYVCMYVYAYKFNHNICGS